MIMANNRRTEGGMMETEHLDKLYLELSQVTQAITKQEMDLYDCLKMCVDYIKEHHENVPSYIWTAYGMEQLYKMRLNGKPTKAE